MAQKKKEKKKFLITNSSTLKSDGKAISRILSCPVGAAGSTLAQGRKWLEECRSGRAGKVWREGTAAVRKDKSGSVGGPLTDCAALQKGGELKGKERQRSRRHQGIQTLLLYLALRCPSTSSVAARARVKQASEGGIIIEPPNPTAFHAQV